MSKYIKSLGVNFDISEALKEIHAHPELWDEITLRTAHKGVDYFHQSSDIWLRTNDLKNYDPLHPAEFVKDHHSVWYPSIEQLPAVKDLIFKVMTLVRGEELGGVLLTRVPVGGMIKPHTDSGWHQEYHEKFAVQIQGNYLQAFHFEDGSLSADPGDVYWFDNSFTHWVTNDSGEDRITLIISIKRSPDLDLRSK